MNTTLIKQSKIAYYPPSFLSQVYNIKHNLIGSKPVVQRKNYLHSNIMTRAQIRRRNRYSVLTFLNAPKWVTESHESTAMVAIATLLSSKFLFHLSNPVQRDSLRMSHRLAAPTMMQGVCEPFQVETARYDTVGRISNRLQDPEKKT